MSIYEINILLTGIYLVIFGLLVKPDEHLISTIFGNFIPIVCGVNCIIYFLLQTGVIK